MIEITPVLKYIPKAAASGGINGRFEHDGLTWWPRPHLKSEIVNGNEIVGVMETRCGRRIGLSRRIWDIAKQGDRDAYTEVHGGNRILVEDQNIKAAAFDARMSAMNAAPLSPREIERRRLERKWDALNNEGGDGYNPYRTNADLSGTAFDGNERHYPEGA